MQNIFTGIYNLYSNDTDLSDALTGGLRFLKAPQGVSCPYAVYFAEGGPGYMFTGTSYELPQIQFDVFAESNSDRQAAYDALVALYDDATPTAMGFTPIIMERASYRFLRTGDQWQIFQATVIYNCRFEKQ